MNSRAVSEMGTACFRLVDVECDEADDDESDCDGLQCCFSLSLVRSRPLSNDSGVEEFDRSFLDRFGSSTAAFVSPVEDDDAELVAR